MKTLNFIWLVAMFILLMGADLVMLMGVFLLVERLLLGVGIEPFASTLSGGVIAIASSVYLHFRQDMRSELVLQTTKGTN